MRTKTALLFAAALLPAVLPAAGPPETVHVAYHVTAREARRIPQGSSRAVSRLFEARPGPRAAAPGDDGQGGRRQAGGHRDSRRGATATRPTAWPKSIRRSWRSGIASTRWSKNAAGSRESRSIRWRSSGRLQSIDGRFSPPGGARGENPGMEKGRRGVSIRSRIEEPRMGEGGKRPPNGATRAAPPGVERRRNAGRLPPSTPTTASSGAGSKWPDTASARASTSISPDRCRPSSRRFARVCIRLWRKSPTAGWKSSGKCGRYPPSLVAFLAECAARGQTRPTPLLLRYRSGGYNCLAPGSLTVKSPSFSRR